MAITKFETAQDVRAACSTGAFSGVTAGLAPKQVQANLIILSKEYADDFRRLCMRNPVACPLIGESLTVGDWRYSGVVGESDIRVDVPGYNVGRELMVRYKDGKLLKHDVGDYKEFWTEDSVAFLIGCSYTFEDALSAAGLVPRHQEIGRNVPMYKTNIPLSPSGVFQGCTVVSMRPYRVEDVERVRDITRPYIKTHGEPIAWGPDAAERIGIADVLKPDFGDAPVLREGEVPVFWACGVTPQLAVMSSPKVKGIVGAHAPGKMLCLDILIEDLLRS